MPPQVLDTFLCHRAGLRCCSLAHVALLDVLTMTIDQIIETAQNVIFNIGNPAETPPLSNTEIKQFLLTLAANQKALALHVKDLENPPIKD